MLYDVVGLALTKRMRCAVCQAHNHMDGTNGSEQRPPRSLPFQDALFLQIHTHTHTPEHTLRSKCVRWPGMNLDFLWALAKHSSNACESQIHIIQQTHLTALQSFLLHSTSIGGAFFSFSPFDSLSS